MPVILTDEIQLHTGLIVPADTTSTVEFIPADSKNERRVVTLQLVSNEPPATGNGVIFWWVDEKGVEYPAWQVLLDGGEGTDGTNPAKAGMNDTDTVGFQQDEDGNYFFNIPKCCSKLP